MANVGKSRKPLLSPVIRNPGAGDIFPYFAADFERVLSRAESYDAMNILRLTLTPDGAPPLHVHEREEETWVVLSGEVKFWTGGRTLGECETAVVTPGGVAYGPRLVPHTFQTHTPTAEVLILTTPGYFEDHMVAIGDVEHAKKSNTPEAVSQFGVTLLDRAPIFGQD